MRCILHIGLPKTGTTSVQHLLQHNRTRLRAQGYCYPQFLFRGQPTAANCSHNQLARYLCFAEGADPLAAGQAELAGSGCNGIIISAEMLSHFMDTPEHVASLQRWLVKLGCSEISVVVWVREQGSMLASLISQDLRNGRPEWGHFQLPHCRSRYGLTMDYRALLQRWAEVFGREALTVRLFERECFVQGDLLQDAIAAFGLEWDERFITPPRVNESLNLAEMELLRVLNHQLPGHTNIPGTPKYHLSQVLHRHLGRLQGDELRFAPPEEIVQAWRAWAAEGNEWVRQEFFPDRPTLFAPPREQAENYELQHLTPGCWEALGRVLTELSEENFRLHRQLPRQGQGR